jgi:hypothetical protein
MASTDAAYDTFLAKNRLYIFGYSHLYKPGMTLEQAKQAIKNDPHYQSENAKYFLREHSNAHNTNYMRLYREGMNRKEAEAALYNDNEYKGM